jgi:hypothetical protein
MAWIRDAVNAALVPAVPSATVVPGAIAWDSADCGALYVSAVRYYHSNEFPDIVALPTGNCDASWDAAEIVVQVVRCVNGPDGSQSIAPPRGALDGAAQQIASDAWYMMTSVTALLCQLEEQGTIGYYLLGETIPLGPTGANGGTDLRVVIGISRG